MRAVSLLSVPTDLGLRRPDPQQPVGVVRLAGALRDCGLLERLSAVDEGTLAVPPYVAVREPSTGVLNPHAIATLSSQLADRLSPLFDQRRLALLLGGDCSVTLGAMLGLRRRGRYGILFLDGHTDFYSPASSQSGGVAGMDLAILCNRGPELLTNLEGLAPLVREEDVVLFGRRDLDEAREYGGTPDGTDILDWPLDEVRARGMREATRSALMRFAVLDGFWIHVDVDVLDNDEMPAVDSPQPGGMTMAELTTVLATATASPKCMGLDLSIFDPDQDEDGSIARRLTDTIVAALA